MRDISLEVRKLAYLNIILLFWLNYCACFARCWPYENRLLCLAMFFFFNALNEINSVLFAPRMFSGRWCFRVH